MIPDIHDRIDWIEPFLKVNDYDEVVFTGDYFDSYTGTVIEARATAHWLRHSLHQPKRVHLFGNHDIGYAFQQVDKYHRRKLAWLKCSGNTDKKLKEIRKIIPSESEAWRKLKLLHITQRFHLSHAGLSEFHFAHPVFGYSKVEERCEVALDKLRQGFYDQIIDAGLARSGNLVTGGILWQDWTEEFVPIEGINQIVGHTKDECRCVRDNHFYERAYAKWLNYCIDTDSRHVAIIEDGEVSFKRTDI